MARLATQDRVNWGSSLCLATPRTIHGLQVFDPAVQTTVSFHEHVPDTSNFIDVGIATHESRLLTICPKHTFGIDSGETNSGARYESWRHTHSSCA
jgi:hypothetical protein